MARADGIHQIRSAKGPRSGAATLLFLLGCEQWRLVLTFEEVVIFLVFALSHRHRREAASCDVPSPPSPVLLWWGLLAPISNRVLH